MPVAPHSLLSTFMKGLLAVLDDEVWAKQILTRSPLPSNPMYWSVWGGIPPSM